ncbi:hypothetical protein C0Q70_21598 [Pomacea canaliculata]|uniref:Uncharacterized protein n=1 Tax=Pomacea canaliculata TaxID=400727 RepID=A0A2T7NCZ4_POMCA|nr:hypothetical protein C0Q70_21598 [Pomacea canaliculata]
MQLSMREEQMTEKCGVNLGGQGETTASWTVPLDGKDVTISFSRDNCFVVVDGEQMECTAYISDQGFDLDLIFDFDDHRVHVYSDVEGSEMTNYLFIDDQLRARKSMKNCLSDHRKN